MIDPVRPIAIEDIEQARARIAGTVLRTPLVRFDERIWL
jgi:threonine dehydratase